MAIKDSQFTPATTPLDGTEQISILQSGGNALVGLLDLISKNNGQSTGLISGGQLSINATDNTLFDISPAILYFTDYTNPENPKITYYSYAGSTGNSVTNIATTPATTVALDSNGTIIQQTNILSNTQSRTLVSLGLLIHSNNTNINLVNRRSRIVGSQNNQLYDLMNAIGPLNVSGNNYSYNGTNLNINKSVGEIFKYSANYDTSTTDPHTISISANTPVTFRYRLQNSTEYADTTAIDPNNYDNAGVLTTVPSNDWTIQHIALFQEGATRIQYGQHTYASLPSAIDALLTESFITETNIQENGILRCLLIVKQGTTALSNTSNAVFVNLTKFGSPAGGSGYGVTSSAIISALGYTPAHQTKLVNLSNANYTFTSADKDVIYYKNDTTAYNYTVNGSVLSVGDKIKVFNAGSSGAISIVQGTSMTLQLSGSTTTGTRTVAAGGEATITFLTPTLAFVSGYGVT